MAGKVVTNDSVVGIHYTLRGEDSQVIDTSDGLPAFIYLHGHSQIVPGLERSITGRSVGDKFKVEVSPEDGYGTHSDEMAMTFKRSQFPEGAAFEVGNEFELVGENEEVLAARIVGLEGDQVMLDANHPLAGKKLFFDVEIVSLREATDDELDHGHAHGEGGHTHEE